MVFGRSLLRFIFLALVSLALVLAGSACQDSPPEDEDPGPPDTGISGSDDDDSSGGIGGDDDSAAGDDDATEPPWPAGQAGEVSYTYFFDQPSAIYWDCIRSYYWLETGDTPAAGCTECERTWHVVYSIAFDSCGTWGFTGDGYELSVGVDEDKGYLWLTHDAGANWLRFPGQGSVQTTTFIAEYLWEDECVDQDADQECDPGSELDYLEAFEMRW